MRNSLSFWINWRSGFNIKFSISQNSPHFWQILSMLIVLKTISETLFLFFKNRRIWFKVGIDRLQYGGVACFNAAVMWLNFSSRSILRRLTFCFSSFLSTLYGCIQNINIIHCQYFIILSKIIDAQKIAWFLQ